MKVCWKMNNLYKFSLYALEKLDTRDTFTKRLGYKFARKIFDKSFQMIYNQSPYDYNRWYSDDV